jgi:hypothetical protein
MITGKQPKQLRPFSGTELTVIGLNGIFGGGGGINK